MTAVKTYDRPGDIGAEVDRRAKLFMQERGVKEYSVAVHEALRADPLLKAAYANESFARQAASHDETEQERERRTQAGEELDRKIRAYRLEHPNCSYVAARDVIFRLEPALKLQYAGVV